MEREGGEGRGGGEGRENQRERQILCMVDFATSCHSRHDFRTFPLLLTASVSWIQRPWADDPMTWRSWCSYRRYEVTDERHCNLCRVIGCARAQTRFSGHQVYVSLTSCKISILYHIYISRAIRINTYLH